MDQFDISPWECVDLTPAELLALLACRKEPNAPAIRIVGLTGMEIPVCYRALRVLIDKRLIPSMTFE